LRLPRLTAKEAVKHPFLSGSELESMDENLSRLAINVSNVTSDKINNEVSDQS